AAASSGIHIVLMKLQNGVQPARLRPVQSSDDARKPSGIDESNRTFARRAGLVSARPAGTGLSLAMMFKAATPSAATTSKTNGTPSQSGISPTKSIAKRPSKIAATAQATQNNNR